MTTTEPALAAGQDGASISDHARPADAPRLRAAGAPHRLMAHLYVRYGGDLSGGQPLAVQSSASLRQASQPEVSFWAFDRPRPPS